MRPCSIRNLVLILSLTWALCGMAPPVHAEAPGGAKAPPDSAKIGHIKAYCLDFNWAPTGRRGRPFAKLGQWAGADPARHVAWYKATGANVIQTFCVSTNGYAWYKNGFVPEQPGLKHDFLPEVVKLGRQEGMLVMGYFCIASNPKWGTDHPDLSYGTPTTYHIPYTDAYLDYLSKSIQDAVRKTGIDGFMIDWLWMPNRKSTEGKWLTCEKKLYEQLMGEPFPGEDTLTGAQDTQYSRKAIDRCWKAIRKAAKAANPNCVVWLTVNKINHPHVLNSDMYKEADWLMNEAGSMKGIDQIKDMVGKHTRLITCMARWNGQDATEAVPEALAAGVGLYGFTTPRGGDGLVPLDKIFTRQVSELSGDSRNIAVLARAYHGRSIHALWSEGRFVEPDVPPPFRIRLKGRGRGFQDTASISHEKDTAAVTVTTPYSKGRVLLIRTGKAWPSSVTIRLQKRVGQAPSATSFRMANGVAGFGVSVDGTNKVSFGKMEGGLDLGREWRDKFLAGDNPPTKDRPTVRVARTEQAVEIVVPAEMMAGHPQVLAFEWD
ncbi:hypothetical protein HQ560_05780 [bacterium]|nr:hypothetical protein [bacterium]